MKSRPTFLFSLIILLVVTTAKSSDGRLFKRIIFPTIVQPTIPIPITTTSAPSIPPASPTTTPDTTVTVTILSTSFLPADTPTPTPTPLVPPQVTDTNNFSTYVPSTTVEVIKTVAPQATNPTDSDSSGADSSYYEGSGNSLIVEGIGIKMSIAAVFLNVFYVLFA